MATDLFSNVIQRENIASMKRNILRVIVVILVYFTCKKVHETAERLAHISLLSRNCFLFGNIWDNNQPTYKKQICKIRRAGTSFSPAW